MAVDKHRQKPTFNVMYKHIVKSLGLMWMEIYDSSWNWKSKDISKIAKLNLLRLVNSTFISLCKFALCLHMQGQYYWHNIINRL
jgi:hypothetical protein